MAHSVGHASACFCVSHARVAHGSAKSLSIPAAGPDHVPAKRNPEQRYCVLPGPVLADWATPCLVALFGTLRAAVERACGTGSFADTCAQGGGSGAIQADGDSAALGPG